MQVDSLSAEVVFAVVGHDDEREEERVVVLGSQQNVLRQVHLHQVVVVHEQVTPVRVQDYKAEVCRLVEKLQSPRLSLRKILHLSYHMLRVHSVFELVLGELVVDLVDDILCGLLTVQSGRRNEHGRLLLLWLLRWLLLLGVVRRRLRKIRRRLRLGRHVHWRLLELIHCSNHRLLLYKLWHLFYTIIEALFVNMWSLHSLRREEGLVILRAKVLLDHVNWVLVEHLLLFLWVLLLNLNVKRLLCRILIVVGYFGWGIWLLRGLSEFKRPLRSVELIGGRIG